MANCSDLSEPTKSQIFSRRRVEGLSAGEAPAKTPVPVLARGGKVVVTELLGGNFSIAAV